MNKRPFVSVVVCTYNGEKHIKDCLDALTKQDYPKDKYETIVVDDDSANRTNKIVSKYSVKVIKHQNLLVEMKENVKK